MVSTQSPSASDLFSSKNVAAVASDASARTSGVQALYLEGDFVQLLDQNALPETKIYLPIGTVEEMADAIQVMKVRGAPAIGIAAAYGLVLDAQNASRENVKQEKVSVSNLIQRLRKSSDLLGSTRPTAVNLAWALNEMSQVIDQAEKSHSSVDELVVQLRKAALKIHHDDIAACKEIGRLGATLFPQKAGGLGVLTHCNAGALATGGYGTALGVIRSVFERDSKIRVYADETRPRFQGARLTTWELVEDGIPVTLIADNMSAVLMRDGLIDRIVVGADRITANGDVANKIGTYGVAVLANAHNIPFYVAAPLSTIDLSLAHGKDIPIEERDASEIWNINGAPICAKGTQFFNPAFDVTPAHLVKAIITEKGIVEGPDYNAGLAALFK
jgi:methylthioribose-1-phosphate isomerase